MAKLKLKTIEDLQKYADGADEEISKLTSTVNEQGIQVTAFIEKLKSLQTIIKGGKRGFAGAAGDGVESLEQTDLANVEFEKFLKTTYKKHANEELSVEDRDFLLAQKDKGRRYFLQKALVGTPLVDDSTTGSYVVPEEWHNEIDRVVHEASQLVPLVTNFPMKSRVKYIPVKNAGVGFTYIPNDSDATTEASPTFGQKTLTSYSYFLWISLTEALLEDDIAGLGAYFREIVGEAYVDAFESEFLTGIGAPTTGILTNASVRTTSMSAGSSGFGDIKIGDFINMEGDLSERNGALRGARFLMSPYTWNLVRGLTDADGRPYIHPGWTGPAARELLGYPVLTSYQMPDSSDSAVNTPFIALGNPRYFAYGDRVGLEMKLFDNTIQALKHSEIFFRFRFRAAFEHTQPADFTVLKTAPA